MKDRVKQLPFISFGIVIIHFPELFQFKMLAAVTNADEASAAPIDEQGHQVSVARVAVHHVSDLRTAQILGWFAAHIDKHFPVTAETPEHEEHRQQQHAGKDGSAKADIERLGKSEICIGQVDLDGRQLIILQRLAQITADDIAADLRAQRIFYIAVFAGARKHFLRIERLRHMDLIMQMLHRRIHACHKCPIQHLSAFRQMQIRRLHRIGDRKRLTAGQCLITITHRDRKTVLILRDREQPVTLDIRDRKIIILIYDALLRLDWHMTGLRDRPYEAAAVIVEIQVIIFSDQQSAILLHMYGDVQVFYCVCLAGAKRNAEHACKQRHQHDA